LPQREVTLTIPEEMSKIIEIQYNGELGYKTPISEVRKFFKIRMTDEDFLGVKKSKGGYSNRDFIFLNYSDESRLSLNITTAEQIEPSMPCPIPMILFADATKVDKDILFSQGNVLADNTQVIEFKKGAESSFIIRENVFYEDIIKENFKRDNRSSNFGSNKRQSPKPLVWLWSKSLNEDGVFNPNSLFNLTPFIDNLSINQTESGGNFNISLLPIEGIINMADGVPEGIWHPEKSAYLKFNKDSEENYAFKKILNKMGFRKSYDFGDTYGKRYQSVDTNNVNARDRDFSATADNYSFNRTEALFKNIIAENDLIFISFSDHEEIEYVDDFFVNHSNLQNRDWQMIGLVDSNQISNSFENSSSEISISGRDCMKLLIEDGSYFFTKSFANPDNTNSAFSNVDLPNRGDGNNALNIVQAEGGQAGINRLITTGMIDMLFNPEARNVNFIMNLLMSRLSNIEICYSDLFAYYGEKRTEFTVPIYEVEDVEEEDINEDLD